MIVQVIAMMGGVFAGSQIYQHVIRPYVFPSKCGREGSDKPMVALAMTLVCTFTLGVLLALLFTGAVS